jgi:hypothetical protein
MGQRELAPGSPRSDVDGDAGVLGRELRHGEGEDEAAGPVKLEVELLEAAPRWFSMLSVLPADSRWEASPREVLEQGCSTCP